jgi:hypothetical protein
MKVTAQEKMIPKLRLHLVICPKKPTGMAGWRPPKNMVTGQAKAVKKNSGDQFSERPQEIKSPFSPGIPDDPPKVPMR